MANLVPTPSWDGVYQIETTDQVLGGPGGVANTPAQNLANQNLYARKHGGALPFLAGLSYDIGDRVKLADGTVVSSTVPGNTTDPNTDMTDWVKTNEASQIVDSRVGISQADINKRFDNSKDKPTVQQVIDSLDPSANIIKRGQVYFNPLDEINITSPINISKMRIDLEGRNSVLKWEGVSATDAMIRVYDSSFTKIKNMSVIGDDTNPPLAAILFDNDSSALVGTNEKCTVENVLIGRKYLTDTDSGGSINIGTPYGRVQNGILVRAGGYGNNDEHTFRNVVANDATVAGFNLDGDQHIWTSFENCLANGCATGYRLGSNVTMYNVQANRNSVADIDGIRNTEHQIFGLYIENPKLAIKSLSASFFVVGGKILKAPTVKEPIIQYLAGGTLSLRGLKIDSPSNPQFNYIDYAGGTVKPGAVVIKECTIANGSKRDFYKIHSATAGWQQTIIDIQHGSFVFQTENPYGDSSQLALAVAANSTGVYSASSSQLVYGKYLHSAVGAAIGGTAQVPICLDTSTNRVRVMNRSGSTLNIPDTQVRTMDLGGHIKQSALSAPTDMAFLARGAVKTNIPLFGVKLGDYIVPTSTTTPNTYVLYGYATADNQATVVVESVATGATNLTAQVVGAAKFSEEKARFHGLYKNASLISIGAKLSTSFAVNVPGAQIGSHCLIAPGADLGDLIATAHCSSDGVITGVVYNPTTASVDLNANVFFKVCAIF